jgi:ABC-2 type transport system permease protein
VLRNLFTKTLWDNRRGLLSWMIGTALVAMMYAAFYPQLAKGAMADAVAAFPDSLKQAFRLDDLSSAAGYLGSSTFGILLPLLALAYGTATGARAIAGDEEAGYLDLLLAHPVSRTRLLLQRFAALAAGSTAIAALVFLAMVAIRSAAQLDTISISEFAAQCLALALLAITFGALAFLVGAIVGRRSLVLGVTAALGVLAYAANGFANQLGIAWAQKLSPFHYYIGAEPLKNGIDWTGTLTLAAVTAVLVAAATWAFTRRDLNA